MSLKQIGQNATEEFFEDLIYSVAYGEIISKLNGLIDTGNDYLDNALEGSLNVLASGALMILMRKQEKFVLYVGGILFSALSILIYAPLGKFKDKIKSKFKKGRKLARFLDFFDSSKNDKIEISKVAVSAGEFIVAGSSSSYSSSSPLSDYTNYKSSLVNQDNHKLNYAKAKASMINQQMLFKLFTKKFTPADKEMIRKMTGNSKIDIDSLNKIADFMFVTDDNGDIKGLSNQFMMMINGLGYTHNKGGKNG